MPTSPMAMAAVIRLLPRAEARSSAALACSMFRRASATTRSISGWTRA
jgi:hypothetical protein